MPGPVYNDRYESRNNWNSAPLSPKQSTPAPKGSRIVPTPALACWHGNAEAKNSSTDLYRQLHRLPLIYPFLVVADPPAGSMDPQFMRLASGGTFVG